MRSRAQLYSERSCGDKEIRWMLHICRIFAWISCRCIRICIFSPRILESYEWCYHNEILTCRWSWNCTVLLSLLYVSLPSSGQDDCVQRDIAYGNSDILVGGFYNSQDSWEACQASCQAITDCRYWTWFETGTSARYCELKTANSALPLPGAISGPKDC